MQLGQIVLKIRAANTSTFGNRVGGAAEFALAQEYTVKDSETAFVIPLAEAPTDNTGDVFVSQVNVERFGVVVALKNDAATVDKLGITAHDRLYAVRADLFAILLGWLPTGGERLICYRGGRLLDINPAWLWWQFEFEQATRITSNVDGVEPGLGPYDSFFRMYTQWLVGDASQAILPMQGTPPLLPESLVPPDMIRLIDFKYGFNRGFGRGFSTLESAASK